MKSKESKKISIGYITGHNFGGWCIPQKIQTMVLQSFAKNNNKIISYNISEYLDSKNNSLLFSRIKEDKKIENIFFVSALQLNKKSKNYIRNLKKFNLFFFLENLKIKKNGNIKKLIDYVVHISNRKNPKYKKKKYINIFEDFQKNFNKL